MDISILLSIVASVVAVLSLFFNRADKSNTGVKEEAKSMAVINTKLEYITKQLDNLTARFDRYDVEVDSKIEKAIEFHIKEYHNK